jgi:hypothetical protein
MTPKTWKSCLGVLCLLAAGTANAAKISFSDKGWIDIGALIQGQYRIEKDAASSGKDPSNDFLLRRARIIIAGQYDEHIGFYIDTDMSYGAVGGAGAGTNSGAGTAGATPGTTYGTLGTGGTGAGFNNNIYLLDAVATYKLNSSFMIDAGQMLVPYSHNSLTSGARYAGVTVFPNLFVPNSTRAFRDVGVLIRGLLLDDRLYYRLGVFNGVQTTLSAPAPAPPTGLNPGDAPLFAGMLRFNIFGKEDGYAFCQVCFASSPIVSVGVFGEYQANAIRTLSFNTLNRPGTGTGMITYTVGNADIFADIPFSSDLELSFDVLGTKIWAGSNTPQSGWGVFGLASLRFGVIGPYVQIEYFHPDSADTFVSSAVAGINRTYRGGVSWYIEKHTYKITAEFATQFRQGANTKGSGIVVIPDNHWLGTLQFQAAF